ncbi:transglycosylase domain-containing protein [Priestia abyssalis]|uniref:transglycosylase domain-containing protein n=1 Tax=Priestia abyssalis TaxID=1221450 RepID=UPI001472B686|nr:transglycosylase domain-containing protein [Priestia abyssalis]
MRTFAGFLLLCIQLPIFVVVLFCSPLNGTAFNLFKKKVHELTLGEMAFLASIPNNPSLYDPLASSPKTTKRQQFILKKMLEAKKIGEREYEQARQQPIDAG